MHGLHVARFERKIIYSFQIESPIQYMTKVAWLLLTQHYVRLNLYTNDECWYLEQFAKSWGTHTTFIHSHLERDWKLNLPHGFNRISRKIECLLNPSPS